MKIDFFKLSSYKVNDMYWNICVCILEEYGFSLWRFKVFSPLSRKQVGFLVDMVFGLVVWTIGCFFMDGVFQLFGSLNSSGRKQWIRTACGHLAEARWDYRCQFFDQSIELFRNWDITKPCQTENDWPSPPLGQLANCHVWWLEWLWSLNPALALKQILGCLLFSFVLSNSHFTFGGFRSFRCNCPVWKVALPFFWLNRVTLVNSFSISWLQF